MNDSRSIFQVILRILPKNYLKLFKKKQFFRQFEMFFSQNYLQPIELYSLRKLNISIHVFFFKFPNKIIYEIFLKNNQT